MVLTVEPILQILSKELLKSFPKITKPTLLVDEDKCKINIEKMASKAKKSNVIFRPHFKTHFSAEIADWFSGFGVTCCTVSSVSMAKYFVNHHWKDVTIAFPYNPLESEDINQLANLASIHILIESLESLRYAKKLIKRQIGYFIKIDLGTHRTGVLPSNTQLIKSLISEGNEKMVFQGFLAHAGHTYTAPNTLAILDIFQQTTEILGTLRKRFGGKISYGDTPSCSLVQDFSSLDEIRPGNFVFYDIMQKTLGVCTQQEIAVCVAAPVVAKHFKRNEIVVYAGAVHLSKEFLMINNKKCFGIVVKLNNNIWDTYPIGYVSRLSQEHGIVTINDNYQKDCHIGSLVGILPIHSCLTANLQGKYLSTHAHTIHKMLA